MPLFLAASVKSALLIGAVVGGTVALVSNKDKLMEITAGILQKGADVLNERVEKNKIKMACSMRDGELAEFESRADSEATTPDTTDFEESETDEDWDDEGKSSGYSEINGYGSSTMISHRDPTDEKLIAEELD